MKQFKKGSANWNSSWEPNFTKPTAAHLSESITQEKARDIAYATQIQIAEKPSVGLNTPEVNWDTGKEWLIDSVIGHATNVKEYLKKKIYKPDDITVEQFSVALTKGAKYANTLLNRGFNINKQDAQGNTVFMVACQNFKREWIDFLLDVGADVNITNNENESPLMYICKNSSLEVKGKIPTSSDLNKSELEKLKEQNQMRKDIAFDTFNTLIRVGAELDIQSNSGFTALTYAVRRGNTDIVQKSIEMGARIDVYNKDGSTPLDIAIENGYIMTSQLLFQLDDHQLETLTKIQEKYPSNPKFVQFFEILYRNNIEEKQNWEQFNATGKSSPQSYSFLNKKI